MRKKIIKEVEYRWQVAYMSKIQHSASDGVLKMWGLLMQPNVSLTVK